jgi:hypothetical protein
MSFRNTAGIITKDTAQPPTGKPLRNMVCAAITEKVSTSSHPPHYFFDLPVKPVSFLPVYVAALNFLFKNPVMKLKLLAATVIVMALSLHTTEAQIREGVQRHRMREGVRSGELTRSETRNLALRERNTRRDVRMAKRDGVITRRERREIRRDKRMTSRAIYRKKHNRRHRI